MKVFRGLLRAIECALAVFTYETHSYLDLVSFSAEQVAGRISSCFALTSCCIKNAYQSIAALQGVLGDSGSSLPLHEGTGSCLAIWIAKSFFFFPLMLRLKMYLSPVPLFLPALYMHMHPSLPHWLVLPKEAGR